MDDQKKATPTLNIPLQRAPVFRTTIATGVAQDSGVEASGWFDDIVSTVGTIGKVAGPILGGLGI